MMNVLREELYVNCPVSQARRHFEAFFRERAQHLTLRVPLTIPGLHMGMTMQRDVKATIEHVSASSDAVDILSVTWEAIGGGPYPRFEGRISVKGDEDYHSFRLLLEGTYTPPFGLAGEAFDALVGRWIAIATARDLLERMREAIESSYREIEASKVSRQKQSV